MATIREALAKTAFVRMRPLLKRLEMRLPWLYRAFAALGRTVFPWEDRMWIRCENGFAAGLYFKVNPRFETEYIYGKPEPVDRLWIDYLPPGGVFYDVGSQIGYFAIAAARRVGPEGKVYAFEPDPANARLIAENALRNHVEVEVVERAVWRRSEPRMRFARASPSWDPSRMSGQLDGAEPGKQTIEVETVTLDDFVRAHRPPDFIKIDVEGAEADVVEGARDVLLRLRPVVAVEAHSEALRRRVADILEQSGYRLRQVPPEVRLWLALPNRD
jgi:FkbM family methyltransferase